MNLALSEPANWTNVNTKYPVIDPHTFQTCPRREHLKWCQEHISDGKYFFDTVDVKYSTGKMKWHFELYIDALLFGMRFL